VAEVDGVGGYEDGLHKAESCGSERW
jgi:hypothetical protein